MVEAMPPGSFLYTSESVTEGNPDKLCDRISDAVLDACLTQDPEARVACEACTKTGMVMVLGEVCTKASVNYEQVIREAVKGVGYDSEDKGLDWRTMNVIVAVDERSEDLASAIASGKVAEEIGAFEHGSAFGYATDETPERMPLSHVLASKLCAQLDKVRKDGTLAWVRPNGWAQVTIEYKEAADGAVEPARVHSAALCVAQQASLDLKTEQFEKDIMEQVVKAVLPSALCDDKTTYSITPLMSKSVSGPQCDSGLTGRKIGADSYGGWGSHSGGAFSGRDGTKVSRGAAYGARWAAKSLVEAKLCKRCVVQLTYTPGASQTVSVHSYGTAKAAGKTDAELAATLLRSFDFRTGCLQRDLSLKTPQFQKLSSYGQVGRPDLELAWEKPKALK